MTKAQSDDNAGSERFDAYLDKLRAIVEKMEQGGVGLEESLKLFEEGIQVSRRLFGILNDVEGKGIRHKYKRYPQAAYDIHRLPFSRREVTVRCFHCVHQRGGKINEIYAGISFCRSLDELPV